MGCVSSHDKNAKNGGDDDSRKKYRKDKKSPTTPTSASSSASGLPNASSYPRPPQEHAMSPHSGQSGHGQPHGIPAPQHHTNHHSANGHNSASHHDPSGGRHRREEGGGGYHAPHHNGQSSHNGHPVHSKISGSPTSASNSHHTRHHDGRLDAATLTPLSPSGSGAVRMGFKPRPPPPALDCSKDEFIAYLETYQMTPLPLDEYGNVIVDEEAKTHLSPASPRDNNSMREAYAKAGRRITISDASFNPKEAAAYQAKEIPKTHAEAEELTRALCGIPFFRHLEDWELDVVVRAMSRGRYARGEYVTREGPYSEEDKFYVIFNGVARVERRGQDVRELGRGMPFGENDIMNLKTREESLRVVSNSLDAWELSRQDIRLLMRGASMRKREHYIGLLSKVDFLRKLNREQMTQLADALKPAKYAPNSNIIQYGSEGEFMHIILEGKVDVYGRREGKIVRVCDFGPGDIVGELEFLNNHPTVADVVAVTNVRTAMLGKNHFELCMGPVKDMLAHRAEHNPKFEYYRSRH